MEVTQACIRPQLPIHSDHLDQDINQSKGKLGDLKEGVNDCQ